MPADKRLHADDVARQAVTLRLQIKRKLAALDADAHVAEQALMLFQLLHNLLGKAADAVIQLAPDRPGCNLRIVAQHADIVGMLIHRADAQQRQKAIKLLIILDTVENQVIYRLRPLVIVRHTQEKVIAAKIPGDIVVLLRKLRQLMPDCVQQLVPLHLPIPVVEKFEMLYVDGQHAPAVQLLFRQQLLHLTQEVQPLRQSRQGIQVRRPTHGGQLPCRRQELLFAIRHTCNPSSLYCHKRRRRTLAGEFSSHIVQFILSSFVNFRNSQKRERRIFYTISK